MQKQQWSFPAVDPAAPTSYRHKKVLKLHLFRGERNPTKTFSYYISGPLIGVEKFAGPHNSIYN